MRVFAFLFFCLLAGSSPAQEIRRALPVQQRTTPPSGVEIRRALPANPVLRTTPNAPVTASAPAPTPAPPPLIPNPQVAGASVNDTAHFLAGLPVSESSPLLPLTRDPAWQEHARFFDQAWARLEARQLGGLRNWVLNYLPNPPGTPSVLYYFFSGPDFLYANQFFPNANTYVLAGTEPLGPLPDISRFAGSPLAPVLQNLQSALNSVLRFSFFITKDMKSDLQRPALQGTLPIFYVFLARSGKTITDISFVTLDANGNPQISAPGPVAKRATPGVRITFAGVPGIPPQTLYYFTTDLSDGGIEARPGFMKFCAQLGSGDSLLKSASYLMFEAGFEKARDFLLTHSRVIVQDDSGIPLRGLDPAKWDLRLFGAYSGPIEIFKQHFQPDLQALYAQSHPAPIDFGIGYRWNRNQSTLILALHK